MKLLPQITQLVADIPVHKNQSKKLLQRITDRATELRYQVKSINNNRYHVSKSQGFFIQNNLQFQIEVIQTDCRDYVRLSVNYKKNYPTLQKEFKSLLIDFQ